MEHDGRRRIRWGSRVSGVRGQGCVGEEGVDAAKLGESEGIQRVKGAPEDGVFLCLEEAEARISKPSARARVEEP
jgi:hypothetical protein